MRYAGQPTLMWPGFFGAHSWAPMSYSSALRRVFIPTIDVPGYYDDQGLNRRDWKFKIGQSNLGLVPFVGETDPNIGSSALVAWDPVAQKPLWSVRTPGVWNGGTMATAGGLVFQGWADGTFHAFDAGTGRDLWNFRAPNGISGAPISFAVDGRQYVAVVAGWGGSGAAYMGDLTKRFGWTSRRTDHWLLLFALDGQATPPARKPPVEIVPIADPAFAVDPRRVAAGAGMFNASCGVCHGTNAIAAGYAPDLRASKVVTEFDSLRSVLRDGILVSKGMPSYEELSDGQIRNLQHFIRSRARVKEVQVAQR